MNNTQKSWQLVVDRFDLDESQLARLQAIAAWSVSLDISGTAIRSEDDALNLHIADSLAGVELESVRSAASIADIGAGVGFPGLVLASVQPATKVTLVDSVRKKMEAAGRLARELELENVECVWARVEEFGATGSPARESFDVVTSRALAPLTTLVEYSAPLLKVDGVMAAWKGAPGPSELGDAAAAERALGFEPGVLIATKPFKGSARRHFYVTSKRQPTSDRYPRRPGTALRKPLTA